MNVRISLSTRFLLLLLIVLIAQTIATYLVASDRIKKSLVEEKHGEIQLILDMFHHTYNLVKSRGDVVEAHELLTLITQDQSIEAALVVNNENLVIDSLKAEHIGQLFQTISDAKAYPLLPQRLKDARTNKKSSIWYDEGPELIHAVSRIGGEDKLVSVNGALYIRANMLDMEETAISRLSSALAPFAILIAITGAFAVWYFQYFINKRIDSLRRTTSIFAEESRIELEDLGSHDELSELQTTLARMMRRVERQHQLEAAMKSTQQKSDELEGKLALHLRDTPMGVIEWDAEFKVSSWNPAAEKIFGFSAEEAMGQHASFLTPDSSREYVDMLWSELFTTNKPSNSSYRNTTKDGRSLVCDWVNTPLITTDHKAIGVASFVMDKTSEHEVIKSLVKREQEQSEVLNSMTNGVITIDQDGTIKSFNKAAEKLFGYAAHELLDKNISTLMPSDIADQHNEYLNKYNSDKPSAVVGQGREVTAVNKEGEQFPIHLSVSELPKGTDGTRRFIGNCYDLRREKQQQEMLRRSQKMDSLGKLTGGIAHDFNNILGVVAGYSDMLISKLKDQPALEKYANEIKTASNRGSKLTKKLLASSKKKSALSARTNINEVLNNQQDMLRKTILSNIKLIYQTQPDLWPVSLDSDDLEDAILNICINAMHAMPDGGKLCIFTYNTHIGSDIANEMNITTGDYVALCITDTGIGMDEETKERLFEPFFTTKGDKGTGLGLSQVFGFIDRSDAAIKVDSNPGLGSQFSIFFPRLIEQETFIPQANTSTPAKEVKVKDGKERILVVDDEEALRNLCAEILGEHDYHVTTAESGEEALKILQNQSFELLLSDIVMPGIDGYKLAEKAKELHPDIKIQLASGYDPNQREDYGDATLKSNIISKPYSPFILLKQVRHILDNPKT